MNVFSLRTYQRQCRVVGPEKHYCPCGCGKEVLPGTSLIIEGNRDASSQDTGPDDEEFHINWNGDDGQEYEDEDSTVLGHQSLIYGDAVEEFIRSQSFSQDEHDVVRDDTPELGTLSFDTSHDEKFEDGVCVKEVNRQKQKPSQHGYDSDHFQSNMPNREYDNVVYAQDGAPSGSEGDIVPVPQLAQKSKGEAAI